MFKVGDKVRAFGVDGVVTNIHNRYTYPVIVDFGIGKYILCFTSNGKYQDWHKEPTLVLVERAEKFEEVVGYVSIYKRLEPVVTLSIGSIIRETKEEAVKQKNAVGYQEIKYFRKVK